MIFKKYIDEHTVTDLPQNGVITVDIENDKGEITQIRTGVSNLPLAFENDVKLANMNGYYEYTEDDLPEYDENTQYLAQEYTFDGNTITKIWRVKSFDQN